MTVKESLKKEQMNKKRNELNVLKGIRKEKHGR